MNMFFLSFGASSLGLQIWLLDQPHHSPLAQYIVAIAAVSFVLGAAMTINIAYVGRGEASYMMTVEPLPKPRRKFLFFRTTYLIDVDDKTLRIIDVRWGTFVKYRLEPKGKPDAG